MGIVSRGWIFPLKQRYSFVGNVYFQESLLETPYHGSIFEVLNQLTFPFISIVISIFSPNFIFMNVILTLSFSLSSPCILIIVISHALNKFPITVEEYIFLIF